MTRNHSATTVGSRGSGSSSTNAAGWAQTGGAVPANKKDSLPPPPPSAGPNAGFIKIKIFHRATDDLVAIRVPPSVTYDALLEKVRDRLGDDINVLRYREQLDTGGSGMMRLSDDDDLRDWLSGGAQKLTLYADTK